MIAGFPVKLPDGTWGACVHTVEDIKPGERVAMTSRQGETWKAEVTSIVEGYRGTFVCKVRRLSS